MVDYFRTEGTKIAANMADIGFTDG